MMRTGFRGGDSPVTLPEKDIVVFSTADWDHCIWTNNQHIASRFALRGFRILYLESLGLRRPTMDSRDLARIVHRLVRGLRGFRRVAPGVRVLSPLVLPFHGRSWARWLNRRLMRLYLWAASAVLGFRDPILWAYNPMVAPLCESMNHSLIVYHCVDDLAAVPGIPGRAVRAAEDRMIALADVIFTTSPELYRRIASAAPDKTFYHPNVADYNHFVSARTAGPEPEDLSAIPRPRIGFVGSLSGYKLDYDLIRTVAERRPDWHWVFIGPAGTGEVRAVQESLSRPNVHLIGHRDYVHLPAYLRGIDVAVLPCVKNAYTKSMFPLKFFEYLAAGKPVIATRLDALSEYASLCEFADTPEEFTDSVERILAGEVPDEAARDEAARKHTWDRVVGEMLTEIERTWSARSTL
jgi:glycosyltransferase involved in cell wall biosynthesis